MVLFQGIGAIYGVINDMYRRKIHLEHEIDLINTCENNYHFTLITCVKMESVITLNKDSSQTDPIDHKFVCCLARAQPAEPYVCYFSVIMSSLIDIPNTITAQREMT